MEWIGEIAANYGAVGLFVVLVLCSFGFPVAKSLVLVTGGIIAGADKAHPLTLFLACSLGLHGGDFSLFLLGRFFGDAVFEFPIIRRIAPPHLVIKARTFVNRNWVSAVLLARITPFIRGACYILMGSLKMNPISFSILNYLSAALYGSLFFLIGFLIGNDPDRIKELIFSGNIAFVAVILGILASLLLLRKRRQLNSDI